MQAALTVLVRRRPLVTDPRLDLSDLDLSGAYLSGEIVLVDSRFGIGRETFAVRTCAAPTFVPRASSGCICVGQTSAARTCAAPTLNG